MVSVIVPAYNEELTIGKLIMRLEKLACKPDWEIVVVDDGSSDRTSEIAAKSKYVQLVKHPYRKGNGAAVKTGIDSARGQHIVVLDADNQHDPAYIESLLSHLGEYDLVVGARDNSRCGICFRGIGNLLLSKLAGFLVNMNIPDLTSGFRAFKKDKILHFRHLYPNGFSFPSTSTLSFIAAGYNVKFIPVLVEQRDGGSKSKIKFTRDGFRFLLLVLRIVTLFNPLKVFVPVSLFLFMIGLSYALLYIYLIMHIPTGALLTILSSFIIFFFGLIADQISCLRRECK